MTLTKEQMFEAELLNQQLQHIQEYMQRIDKQIAEVLAMREALAEFEKVADGDEMLVPLAAGVFVKARATTDKTLQVNVGNGVVVPKNADGVRAMLAEQMEDMRKYEEELHKQFDQALTRLQSIEKEA